MQNNHPYNPQPELESSNPQPELEGSKPQPLLEGEATDAVVMPLSDYLAAWSIITTADELVKTAYRFQPVTSLMAELKKKLDELDGAKNV